ncbi:olfactory receptor-like protein COR4 [Bombina bombina]|uniref:olfactory receptor-like protein COR4 n=1 Tax=Bombina bombina TaxID=8345 RepID=UPI00235A7C68|nr:olfactory receptor-like protein COR4 [Bombina bombina]
MFSFNHSDVRGFTIQGITDILELQLPLFFFLLLLYLIIITGNMTIVAAISQDRHLYTPMYILLMNLSIDDILLTSSVLPSILHNLVTDSKDMSFAGCITQMYTYISFLCTEVLLLAAMAYDRYVAICHPLHYVLLMSQRHCAYFIGATWSVAFLSLTGYPILVSKLHFCASHLLKHIFCDMSPVMKLSCGGLFYIDILIYTEGPLLGLGPFLFTLISYIYIISTIIKIQSSEGRRKAFSTCASHLTCVILYYGTVISLHLRPTSSYLPSVDKYFSLINVILVPMLNPLIYSFKNQEIRNALNKIISGNIWDAKDS